jgi:hypothetical protein
MKGKDVRMEIAKKQIEINEGKTKESENVRKKDGRKLKKG